MHKCQCMKFSCIISGCHAGARKWRISYYTMLLRHKNKEGKRPPFSASLCRFAPGWHGELCSLCLLSAGHGGDIAHAVQHDAGAVGVGLEGLPRETPGTNTVDIPLSMPEITSVSMRSPTPSPPHRRAVQLFQPCPHHQRIGLAAK